MEFTYRQVAIYEHRFWIPFFDAIRLAHTIPTPVRIYKPFHGLLKRNVLFWNNWWHTWKWLRNTIVCHLTLWWRHNERDGVSYNQTQDCLLKKSGADQRKYQSSASLAFVRGIHRWPVNSPRKGPVTQKIWWRHHDVIFTL